MLSRKSFPPLRIEPQPSHYYQLILMCCYLFAVATLLFAGISWVAKLLLIGLLLLYYYLYARAAVNLTSQHSIRLALWNEAGQWRVRLARGSLQNAQLMGDSLNHPWLVILRFKTLSGHRYSMPLFRDSLPPDLHRRLRARLTVYAASMRDNDLEDR